MWLLCNTLVGWLAGWLLDRLFRWTGKWSANSYPLAKLDDTSSASSDDDGLDAPEVATRRTLSVANVMGATPNSHANNNQASMKTYDHAQNETDMRIHTACDDLLRRSDDNP